MAPLPDTGDLYLRYAPYIKELQEFFGVHDLSHGSPSDLTVLANRLGARGTFAAELASMVRSVIFRERGSIPHADVLALVALASGGMHIEAYAYDLQPSVETLSGFLVSVVRAPIDKAPPVRSEPILPPPSQPFVPEPVPPPPSQQLVPEPVPSAPFEYLPSQPATLESRPFELEPFTPVSFVPEPLQFAPVDPGYAAQAVAEPVAVPAPFLAQSSPDKFAAASLTAAGLQRTSPPASPQPLPNRHRSLWVAGAVAVPVILLAAFLLSRQPATSRPGPATHPASVVASAAPLPLPPPQTPLSDAPASIATAPLQPMPSPSGPVYSPAPVATRPVSAPAVAVRSPSRISVAHTAPTPTRMPASPQPTANTQPVAGTSTQLVAGAPSEPSAPTAAPSALRPDPAAAETATAIIPKELASISSGIMSSHLLASSQPEYPKLATLAHVEGSVILQAVVSKTGKVTAVHVLSGHRLLRTAAMRAVRGWRYRPYIADGRPVDVATIVTLDFKLPN